ncbi:hypothetical protein [Flavobacterium humi]|uniref:Uncharacterized protein n=1 Tax=Flavobacterium humi TaxID=2562683 RepID=A0A4Z0L3E5_9FLAO|nr:hypothetical protein [Flavobacterium humi]TGD56758.1 hypothetical protein E4635_15055 [Flavobacterium humi]
MSIINYKDILTKFNIVIALLLVAFSGTAQTKTIVPQKGAIVFHCKIDITDSELFHQSKKEYQKEFIKDMKESAIIERRFAGIPVDTVKINQAIKTNEFSFAQLLDYVAVEDDNVKFCLEYQGKIVKKYKIRNDLEEMALEINVKTKGLVDDADEVFKYSENNIKEVNEFKNQAKDINGYSCFKVTYTFSEPELSDYSSFMSSYTITREMWVTDKIKSDFHPVINDREIILQYYPLEIVEYSDMIKGMQKIYTLESVSLR